MKMRGILSKQGKLVGKVGVVEAIFKWTK